MLGNRKDADDLPCVFRWHGVEDPLGLAVDHEDLIDKLLYGPRHGLNLEKLAGYRNLFSARANNGDRMLFTTIEKNKQRMLTVCEFVPSHDYHKAKVFKPGVLENFREMHAERLTADTITDKHFIAINEEELDLPVQTRKRKRKDKSKIDYQTKKVDFFLQKFIALDDRQSTAVKSEHEEDFKPTVVTGAAGSGKTCIAVTLLGEKVEREFQRSQREGSPFKPVLYVAESEELCKLVERNWKLSPLAEKFNHGEVQIKTYQQVIRDSELAAKNPVPNDIADIAHFRTFITESIARVNKNKALKQSLGTEFLSNIEKMYKELRIISGYKTATEYCKLAGTQSLISNHSAKEWLFKEATQYKEYLAKKKLIDYALYQPKAENCYAFVIPDEAQDFSWGQLNALLKLAVKQKGFPQVCLLADEQQGLVDPLPKLIYLKTQLEAKLGNMNFVELNTAYRCPQAVVNVANAFLSIGSNLSGRTAKYMAAAPEIEEGGSVELLTEFTDEMKASFRASPPPPGFAVITTDALKQQAIAIFGDVVYTTKEIKGLEFEDIVWFGLMSDKIFYRANKCWLAAKNREFVAEPAERREFAPAFHALYTACTRTTKRLRIFEYTPESLHKLKDLLEELKLIIAKNAPAKMSAPTVKSAAEQSMEIMDQIRTFILANKTDKAHSLGALHKIPAAEIDAMIADLTVTDVVGKHNDAVTASAAQLSSSSATLHGRNRKSAKTPASAQAASGVADYSKSDLEKLYQSRHIDKKLLLALLNHPKANLYLFQTPLFDEGECLFTLMFDKTETRKIIIEELPKRFDVFLPFFTQSALCRKVRYDKDNHLKMIPAFCMTQQPDILKCMSRNDSKVLKIWSLFDADILAAPVHAPNSFLHNTFILFWIAFNDSTTVVINHLRSLKLLDKLTPDQFAQLFTVSDRVTLSFFGCLLHCGEPGYKLAAEILGDNKSLAAGVGMLSLHSYDYPGENQPAAIELLNASIYGKALLLALESINPRLAAFGFTRLQPWQAKLLHKQVRPRIGNPQKKFEQIEVIEKTTRSAFDRAKKLMAANPRDGVASKMFGIQYLKGILEKLLTNEPSEAYIYFFQLALSHDNPVLDQQCWFYQLMFNNDTRLLMYQLLAHEKFGAYLLHHMPINALCGTKMKDQASISPFMWLTSSRERLRLLSTIIYPDSLVTHLMPLGVLGKQIACDSYLNSELGKFYCSPEFPLTPMPTLPVTHAVLLLLTPEGRDILTTLCKNNRDTSLIFSPLFLVNTMLCNTTLRRNTILLAELIRQKDFELTLVMILQTYPADNLKLLTELMFCSFYNQYQDDMKAYARLEAMLSDEKTITFMRMHLRLFPEIAMNFNPVYFVAEDFMNDPKFANIANTLQSKLIKLMKSTPAGLILYGLIRDIILERLNEQSELIAGKKLLM